AYPRLVLDDSIALYDPACYFLSVSKTRRATDVERLLRLEIRRLLQRYERDCRRLIRTVALFEPAERRLEPKPTLEPNNSRSETYARSEGLEMRKTTSEAGNTSLTWCSATAMSRAAMRLASVFIFDAAE